ncbi:MAG: Gfo/Idh/MocA family oxidoreductase [SAR202 cluster bacterium]|mgnify:FL=1|nr:Gfo/Idh/MocA family oxidoreductase [SAR202 cluster bacterium]
MEQIGLAIIGSTGAIGDRHIEAISQLTTCRLVGLNARKQGPLKEQAARLNVKAYPTLSDALNDSEVDAVVIATPHPSHKEITIESLESGKHVLVEKPIGVTPSEADEMVAAARKYNLKLSVLFNNRFRSESIKMKELVDSGCIGEIYRATVSSGMFRTQDYYNQLPWRGTWGLEGGGALLNQGIHAIDLFISLLGLPHAVFGQIRTLKHSIEVEDYASALLEYNDGFLATLHCDTVQAPQRQRMEIYGNQGAIIMDDWNLSLHTLKTPLQDFMDNTPGMFASPEVDEEKFVIGEIKNTHTPAIDDFCRAIIENRDPMITGEEGAKAQELVAAIILSGCTGNRISLPVNRNAYDDLLANLTKSGRLP